MNLLDFAKTLPKQFDDQEFINHLMKSVDLNSIKDLPEHEVDNLFDAAQYLVDYLLLVREKNGQKTRLNGNSYVVYRGPYIEHFLTRPVDRPIDFDQLETLGIGGAEKYLG